MSLLDRTVGFTTALRSAGLPVSTAETVDAVRAMGAIELIDRGQLRAALAASVCKKPAYRSTFDTLFDLWFPPRLGDGASAEPASGDDEMASLADQPVSGDPQAMREALRDELSRLLLDGDEDAIRRFAREAVGLLGRAETQPGRQSWFAYRVLRALSPDTLIAALL